MPKQTIFVYGTLKKDQRNHIMLQSQKHLGSGTTVEQFFMYDFKPGNYPLVTIEPMFPNDISTVISGELYEIDQPTLIRLDVLEGYPDYYDRIPVQVMTTFKGKKPPTQISAIMYIFIDKDSIREFKLMPSGTVLPIQAGTWIDLKHKT